MTLRRADNSDELAIAALASQLGYPSSAEQIRRRLAAMQPEEQYFFRVAENSEGRVVGWIGTCITRNAEHDPVPEISGLVVEEAARSRGVGQALVEAAEAWARGQGFAAITVRTNIIRTRAHGFYRRLGYAVVKTQHAFRKEL
ncbi:MAG: GNAT family N-acetyltransferase [Terriglobales bacterium]